MALRPLIIGCVLVIAGAYFAMTYFSNRDSEAPTGPSSSHGLFSGVIGFLDDSQRAWLRTRPSLQRLLGLVSQHERRVLGSLSGPTPTDLERDLKELRAEFRRDYAISGRQDQVAYKAYQLSSALIDAIQVRNTYQRSLQRNRGRMGPDMTGPASGSDRTGEFFSRGAQTGWIEYSRAAGNRIDRLQRELRDAIDDVKTG